ncbi:hypothetical protein GPECTOR_46g219 [Gonium pectorale]|uniref:1-phosphatidylinositol 4-kinase n=1 Tax=Gonium pectorale TaxID=33097 RepID=A0A150G9X6_GONPE|nr:hypothetical protein GPECTOR_46g219 [Gonium pectorale]|eukprot:KXZ46150.1 hypothetical protein GPECTOR_46g219 [Gonium pectorale]
MDFAENWCSLLELFVSNSGLKLRLPMVDTVLVKGGRVLGHFYTSKEGYICRFSAHEITARGVYQRLAALHSLDPQLNPFGYMAIAHYTTGISRLLKRSELQELMTTVSGPYEFAEPSPVASQHEQLFCVQSYIVPRTDMRYIASYDIQEGPLCTVLARRFSARYTHAMDDPGSLVAESALSDPDEPASAARPLSAAGRPLATALSDEPLLPTAGSGLSGTASGALSAEELLVESQLVALGLLEPRRLGDGGAGGAAAGGGGGDKEATGTGEDDAGAFDGEANVAAAGDGITSSLPAPRRVKDEVARLLQASSSFVERAHGQRIVGLVAEFISAAGPGPGGSGGGIVLLAVHAVQLDPRASRGRLGTFTERWSDYLEGLAPPPAPQAPGRRNQNPSLLRAGDSSLVMTERNTGMLVRTSPSASAPGGAVGISVGGGGVFSPLRQPQGAAGSVGGAPRVHGGAGSLASSAAAGSLTRIYSASPSAAHHRAMAAAAVGEGRRPGSAPAVVVKVGRHVPNSAHSSANNGHYTLRNAMSAARAGGGGNPTSAPTAPDSYNLWLAREGGPTDSMAAKLALEVEALRERLQRQTDVALRAEAALQNLAASSRRESAELRTQVEELRLEVSRLGEVRRTLTAENERLRTERLGLQSGRSELGSEVERLSKELAGERETLARAVRDATAREEALEAQLRTAREEREEALKQLGGLRRRVEEESEVVEALRGQLYDYKQLVSQLQAQVRRGRNNKPFLQSLQGLPASVPSAVNVGMPPAGGGGGAEAGGAGGAGGSSSGAPRARNTKDGEDSDIDGELAGMGGGGGVETPQGSKAGGGGIGRGPSSHPGSPARRASATGHSLRHAARQPSASASGGPSALDQRLTAPNHRASTSSNLDLRSVSPARSAGGGGSAVPNSARALQLPLSTPPVGSVSLSATSAPDPPVSSLLNDIRRKRLGNADRTDQSRDGPGLGGSAAAATPGAEGATGRQQVPTPAAESGPAQCERGSAAASSSPISRAGVALGTKRPHYDQVVAHDLLLMSWVREPLTPRMLECHMAALQAVAAEEGKLAEIFNFYGQLGQVVWLDHRLTMNEKQFIKLAGETGIPDAAMDEVKEVFRKISDKTEFASDASANHPHPYINFEQFPEAILRLAALRYEWRPPENLDDAEEEIYYASPPFMPPNPRGDDDDEPLRPPEVVFLELVKAYIKHVELIVPEVARQLPQLSAHWADPVTDPDAVEQLFEDIFTGLRSLLRSQNIGLQWREQLSVAVRELLQRLVQDLLRMPAAGGTPAPAPLLAASPAQILLRTLTRSQAFSTAPGLPLLPADAETILSWMTANVLPPGGKLTATSPAVPPAGSRAAVGAAAAGDEKLLLLMAQLARTMLADGPRADPAPVADANGGPSGTPQPSAAAMQRTLLGTLLTWSMALVRGVLSKLLQPATGVDALNPMLLMGKQPAAGGGVPQPSAGVTRAAARLAASAMHGLLQRASAGSDGGAGAGSGGGAPSGAPLTLPTASRSQLMEVISMLLDMSEACVSAALEVGPQVAAADKMLDTAAYILEDCSSLIITAAREAVTTPAPPTGAAPARLSAGSGAASMDVGTVFSRLKAILLAAAVLVGKEPRISTAAGADAAAASWRGIWDWDISRPLTASYVHGSRVPGWGAQRLCCNVAEALTCGLAASYHAGVQAYAQALLLLPLGVSGASPAPAAASSADGIAGNAAVVNEALVLSLAMGRLFVLLGGEEALARSMLPLLNDVLGTPATNPTVVTLQASVVQTLAAMAAASVRRERGVTWAYSQISDVLLRLLLDARQRGSGVAAALAAAAEGPGARALSTGLLALAKGLRDAPSAARRDLQTRLLVQFGELGRRAGGSDGSSGPAVVAEMGALLPALAEACEGLEGAGLDFSSRFSGLDLAASQRNGGAGTGAPRSDQHMVKLLRKFWLYCALFGLCSSRGTPADQLAAAGRIAAVTPLLLLGQGPSNELDMAEQLKAELGDLLRLAGESAAAPARLRASLQNTLGVSPSGTPQPPPDANKTAYLLTVATAELCRVKYAPLTGNAESSPISVVLTYIQSADPLSADAAWYTAVAEKAFAVYLERLKEEAAGTAAGVPPATAVHGTHTDRRRASSYPGGRGPSYAGVSALSGTPGNGGAAPGGVSWVPETVINGPDGDTNGPIAAAVAAAADAAAASSVVERCLEGLAVTLIRNLGGSGGHAEGRAPAATAVADRLLRRLLAGYSPLYWRHACVSALLSELEAEEGLDHPLSEVHGMSNLSTSAVVSDAVAAGGGGAVWRWLRDWVRTAASAAPTRTEALLHQFLGQSSIASYTLGGDSPVGAGSLGASAPGASAPAWASQRAHVAALRRAADLLAICAQARRGAAGGAGAGVAADATMALCRKLFYAGAIAGVQHSGLVPSSGPAALAELTLASLDDGLAAAQHSPRLLEQRYLAAAAFLAREAAEAEGGDGDGRGVGVLASSAAPAVCYRLLQGLCSAPLRRFTPDMMGLAVFAWTWITTAGPAWLLPLVSRAAAAWAVTVDRGLGLFSGPWKHDHHHPGSEAAGADADSADGSAREAELLAALACHQQWVAFLYEIWNSVADRTDAERRALAAVFERLLHQSLVRTEALCSHPAAVGPLFRLLQLALSYCALTGRQRPAGTACPPSHALLYERALRAGLLWFAHPVGFSARISQRQAEEQVAAVGDFAALLGATSSRAMVPGPAEPLYDKERDGPSAIEAAKWESRPTVSCVVWGHGTKELKTSDAAELLQTLCRAEQARLRVWARPLEAVAAAPGGPSMALNDSHIKTAWRVSPQLAVAVLRRSTGSTPAVHAALERLLMDSVADPRVTSLPEAALVLASSPAARSDPRRPLDALAVWAPAGVVEGLQLMCGPAQAHTGIKAYALRCLHAAPPAKVAFFLPQLVQALRTDTDGATARFLLDTAAADDLFAHQLIWALATEEQPPPEAFNPEVKRSGWQPPKPTGLWEPAGKLKERALASMSTKSAAFYTAEASYFDSITSISGILKKLEPDERRAKIRSELLGFAPSRTDLYVPTNPDCRVVAHIPESGTPMQSAAKVPILVAFKVEQQQPQPLPPLQRTLACIFKVGDDVRQDVLALQVISILRDAFTSAGLDLYLRPYGCIPTGYERGVIEVVPHTKSRAALGELSDRGLHDIFVSQFGPPGSSPFEAARRNFITSEAGYAIASFLLQAKDRHNGNLLIDSEGHLVHIDFGFILEISPGGNMGFESAAFKLSHEMTQLLDPGGCRNSGAFRLFEELCVRGYLAARTVAEPIIATVALMERSGLPCFGYGKPLPNLRKRFHLEMSDAAAAAFMRAAIADAYQKWTTGFYDYIQALQNRIPY